MKIMGIDPGIGKVGWGIINESKGKLTCVKFDCFETPRSVKTEERLQRINEFLLQLFKNYQPEVVAVEELFFAANSRTALTVGQARGAILLTVSQVGIPVFSYTPLQVKQSITGYGRAEKKQIQKMIQALLKLPSPPKQDDAADALAVAITHAFSYKLQSIQKSKIKGQKYNSKVKIKNIFNF